MMMMKTKTYSFMPFSSILNRQNKHRLGDQNESLIIRFDSLDELYTFLFE